MMHTIENPIVLKGTIQVVDQIKKTKAQGWADVKVGDIIELSTDIQDNSGASNGYYQSYLSLYDKTQDFTFWASFVEFAKYTKRNFVVKQL